MNCPACQSEVEENDHYCSHCGKRLNEPEVDVSDIKDGKKILLVIGWLSVVFALLFFPLFLGIVAVCLGVVLRRDYQEDVKGTAMIYLGVISGIGGWLLPTLII